MNKEKLSDIVQITVAVLSMWFAAYCLMNGTPKDDPQDPPMEPDLPTSHAK